MARTPVKDKSVAEPVPASTDDPAPVRASPPPPPGLAYVLDGKGGIAIDGGAARGRGFQLLLLPPDPSGCLDWLIAEFGQVTAEAMLEADPRPHCTIYDEGVLIALTTVPVAEKTELKNQREAAFWVEKSRVVAVTDMTVEELIGATPGKFTTTAPTTPIHLVTRVALRAADRIEPILDRLSERADDLEEEVLREPTDRTRVGLNSVRRAAITIRRTVLPQRDALTTLETSAAAWYTQRDRSRLREAVGWMNRMTAEIASFTERAALVHEQITDRRAEQLNRALLILAAVTTIFMPLTLITGLIGMNVAGMPFAQEPWAFAVIIVALALIGVLEFLWVRSRKWL